MVEATSDTLSPRRGRPRKDTLPPEPPKLDRPLTTRISALFRAVELALIPASSKLVLNVLLRQCDWTEWTWPVPVDDVDKGLSMAELGQRCGWAGRKTPQRDLPRLESLGLVERIDRRHTTNAFRVFPDAILALGEAGLAQRQAWKEEAKRYDRLPQRRTPATREIHAGRAERRRQAQDDPGAAPPTPPPPPVQAPWAAKYSMHHAIPAAVLEAQVLRIIEAVVGVDQAKTRQGEEPRAKRILQTWVADLKPEIEGWTTELVADIAALRACEEPAARTWREKASSADFRWLTRESYPRLRALARAHRAGLHFGCGAHPAVTHSLPEARGDVHAEPQVWLKLGRRLEPSRAPATGLAWADVLRELHGRVGRTNVETWFEPLILLDEGPMLVLGVPNAYFATWIRENYGTLLDELAGPHVFVLPPERQA